MRAAWRGSRAVQRGAAVPAQVVWVLCKAALPCRPPAAPAHNSAGTTPPLGSGTGIDYTGQFSSGFGMGQHPHTPMPRGSQQKRFPLRPSLPTVCLSTPDSFDMRKFTGRERLTPQLSPDRAPFRPQEAASQLAPMEGPSASQLCSMFPTLSAAVVEDVLQQCEGCGNRALEALLGMQGSAASPRALLTCGPQVRRQAREVARRG